MSQNKSVAAIRWFRIVTCTLYVLFLAFAARNLMEETLWYDEAGQFFISKGLNHWSEPYASEGDLMDVIYSNSHYNQDPGGYSIILHYWSMVSDSSLWLKLLSFLFYIGAIIFTCAAVRKITGNNIAGMISGLVLFALWGGGSQCHELRAYSMELCGMAYGLWMIFYLREHLSMQRLLACSAILSIFITARYTMLMAGGVYCCFVLYLIWRSDSDNTRIKLFKTVTFSLLPLGTVVYVYFAAMAIQNADMRPLSYINYLETGKRVVIFWLLTLIIVSTWRKLTSNLKLLTLIFLAFNLLFIVLGTLKMLPWNFFGNKGGPFIWMLYVMLYSWVTSLLGKHANGQSFRWVSLGAVCIIIAGVSVLYGASNLQLSYFFDTAGLLRGIDYKNTPIIYTSRGASPEVRYLFEYGALTNLAREADYPNKFHMLKGTIHCVGVNKRDMKQLNGAILDSLPSGSILLSNFLMNDTIPESYREIAERMYVKQ